ncbi:MAG: Na(+)/H(+) antiporter subunit B [Saccharofermentanales bacterium]
MIFLEIVVGSLMVIFSILAINTKKKTTSVIYLSMISLLAVIAFILMKAPDVAITEAVIGSGLVTAFFVFAFMAEKKAGTNK